MFHESRLLSKERDSRVTWYGNRAIFAWQLFCRMWLVAVIRLLRYWRVSADSLCSSKKPPRIFPVYAFIYSEFSVSQIWQCRHLQRIIAPSQENFQELSDTSSAWYTWETIEHISSGALLISTTHILFCFFFQSIFLGKNRNEMVIMNLKDKDIGTLCRCRELSPFIFPFIFFFNISIQA